MRSLVFTLALTAATTLAAREPDTTMVTTVLERAAERVERYFRRAQSLVCLEIVRLQPLTSTFSSDGFGRVVESELRLSWEAADGERPSAEAQTLRRVLRVNGHTPRRNDPNDCTAPEQYDHEPQPLSMLLPEQAGDYQFALAGQGRVNDRPAVLVNFRVLQRPSIQTSTLDGRDDCVNISLEGGMRGRLWIDAETYDVLRLDQNLTGMLDIPLPKIVARRPHAPVAWTMERWDTSIRFQRVTFTDPDESLVLPVSQSSLRITRGTGMPGLRTNTEYKNYQRFLTGARVVGD